MRFCYVITAVLIYLVIVMGYALASTLNENTPQYVNQRYGFSLTLPSGHWEVTESANGDGAVLRSTDWNVEVRAYGTMGYSVQGMNFDAAIAKESSIFAKIAHKKIDKKSGRFSLLGVDKGGRDTFLLCYFGNNTANIVIVSESVGAISTNFERVVNSVHRTFTPGF